MKITINPEYDRQVPRLTEQENNELIQSMKDYGQLSPILVNQRGVVLDGHHRFRMCQELGMEPQYKVMIFKDVVEERIFVTKSNLSGKGRHLNKFRRTELALKLKPDLKEIAKKRQEELGRTHGKGKDKEPLVGNQTKGRVDEEIAKMANVSRDTVKKVEKILEYLMEEGETQDATDDPEKLRSEEVSINEAHNRILSIEFLGEFYERSEHLMPQIQKIEEDLRRSAEELGELRKQLIETDGADDSQQQSRREMKREYRVKNEEFNKKRFQLLILYNAFILRLIQPKLKQRGLDDVHLFSEYVEDIEKIGIDKWWQNMMNKEIFQ